MGWSFLHVSRPEVHAALAAPGSGGGTRRATWLSPSEREANAVAADWQVIVHLRQLFERDPTLIGALLGDGSPRRPAGFATTVLVAALEALADRPESASLHYQAARAALQSGYPGEAHRLLERAVELDPANVEAIALLAGFEPHQNAGVEGKHEAHPARPDSLGHPTAGGNDRRGNELPA